MDTNSCSQQAFIFLSSMLKTDLNIYSSCLSLKKAIKSLHFLKSLWICEIKEAEHT